ncbi:MAG: sigma-70 family RNA polymerase sigma factor [Chitinophagaceae bacterium]
MTVAESTVPEYVRSFQEGDEQAFNYFFREHYVALSLFAYRIVRQMEAAEEIAGDAFLKLWERRRGFSHPLAMRSFVYTAARFASLNVVRGNLRERKKIRELGYFCEREERFILQQLISTEVYQELMSAIHSLPRQCRKIFESLFLNRQTAGEVALEMRLSVSTVRNQKARAIQLLRARLEQAGNFSLDTDFIFLEL